MINAFLIDRCQDSQVILFVWSVNQESAHELRSCHFVKHLIKKVYRVISWCFSKYLVLPLQFLV